MENKHLSNHLGGGYWQISEHTIRVFGIEMALWITHLFDWRSKLLNDGLVGEDDFFYIMQNDIEKQTGLSTDKQRNFATILGPPNIICETKDCPKRNTEGRKCDCEINNCQQRKNTAPGLGLLEIDRRGLPAQNFYKIDSCGLIEYIEKQIEIKGFIRYGKRPDLDIKKDQINNQINSNQNNLLSSKEDNTDVPTDIAPHPDDESILWFERDGLTPIWIDPIETPDKVPRKIYSLNPSGVLSKYWSDAERLFDFWNNLGKPLTRHMQGTKIWYESIHLIAKQLRAQKTFDQIRATMKLYHKMLTEPENFILSANARFHKVGLNQFMEFTDYDRNQMRSDDIARKIISWFDECMQGEDYINKTYGRFEKDEYPAVTSVFKRLWEERGYNSDSGTPRGENNFRQASKALIEFLGRMGNKIHFVGMGENDNPAKVVKHVFNAIEMDLGGKDNIEVTTGWLCSRAMYQKRLPDYLKAQGLMN
jgi:hypothetical protein